MAEKDFESQSPISSVYWRGLSEADLSKFLLAPWQGQIQQIWNCCFVWPAFLAFLGYLQSGMKLTRQTYEISFSVKEPPPFPCQFNVVLLISSDLLKQDAWLVEKSQN